MRLTRTAVSPGIEIKTADGIRTLDTLLEAFETGATRVGVTATETILEGFKARETALETVTQSRR